MPAEPTEVAVNPVHLDTLPDLFTPDGLEVQSPGELLQQLGIGNVSQLVSTLSPCSGQVQTAAHGVIQDPAGAAIGAGVPPADAGAGGASGGIYSQFKDLQPIPQIKPGSAIFNSSRGPGRRVLHTFSPRLAGSAENTLSAR